MVDQLDPTSTIKTATNNRINILLQCTQNIHSPGQIICMLGHKTSFNKLKSVEIIQSMSIFKIRVKLETNNKKQEIKQICEN